MVPICQIFIFNYSNKASYSISESGTTIFNSIIGRERWELRDGMDKNKDISCSA